MKIGSMQRRPKRHGPLATVAALALLISAGAGCGSNQGVNSPATFDQGSLEEVGDLYRSVTSRLKKPPTSLKDLAKGQELFTLGYTSVEKGDVVAYWGVTPIPGDQPTDEVLAYKASVPADGGAVLLKNTTVKNMTAAEFAAAPKPAGPTSK